MKQSELDSLLSALQSRGYTRFSNAIATSDILYDVVSSHSSSFTFFAPPDPPVFSLDMADSGEDYTNTLRCHVVSRRLTANQLRRALAGEDFDTLVAGKQIRVRIRKRSVGDDVITVNGVLVSLPGLFYSRNAAVHGLAGILNFTTPPAVVRRRHAPLAPPQAQLSRVSPPPPPGQSQSPDWSANYGDQFHAPPPPGQYDRSDEFDAPANNSYASSAVMNQTNLPNISDVFPNDTIESVVSDPDYGQHSLPMITQPPGYAAVPPGFAAEPPEVTEMNDGYTSPGDNYGGEEIKASFTHPDDDVASKFRSVDDVASDLAVAPPGAIEEMKASVMRLDDDVATKDDDVATKFRSVDDVAASPESFAGVMEMLQADFEKWDQRIFDCLLTDDFGHVSTAPGYLYTRQQPHTSMPSSCSGLHQFLHLEHF